MIPRNICPICGSENPEGSVVCQVCKANLQNLPDDIYAGDQIPQETVPSPEADPDTAVNEGTEEVDLDSPVPEWMKKFLQKDKKERTEFDYDSYADAIFGYQDNGKPAPAPKPSKPRKSKKKESVYQPTLGNMVEAPLVETEEPAETAEAKDLPTLIDFKNVRPVKKWDDPDQVARDASAKRQADKVFQPSAVQMPLWWQQDAPLVEDDSPEETGKSAEEDDPAYFSSVSPTKVMDPDAASEDENLYTVAGTTGGTQAAAAPAPVVSDEYKPESGSLLSDLMNEMNSNSVTPAPRENRTEQNGTVFYSGSQEVPVEEVPAEDNVPVPGGETITSAEALDQILREMGYQTEGEAAEAESADAAVIPPAAEAAPEKDKEASAADESAGSRSETSAGPVEHEVIYPESKITEKQDMLDELDIPWDLFGSQDMSLPRSPEDPALRTFSRSGIPSEQDSSTYQQRMMSSILEKIIYAENFVPAVKKKNPRAVSMLARLFWALLALGGIVLILMTGITDNISLPAVSDTAETEAFYGFAEKASGNALVVMDYTPAYSAELDAAAEGLLTSLEDSADKVYLCSLNPAAMPKIQQILASHKDKLEFAGWWPAGLISIRSRLASGSLPENIWLVTADSGSVRNWAEQLSAGNSKGQLHVLASGQLEPILRPYLDAGMVASAMSRDADLVHYGTEAGKPGRDRIAVLYLTALVPLAWLGGVAAKFLGSDPNYGRKNVRKESAVQIDPEKGAANDGRL